MKRIFLAAAAVLCFSQVASAEKWQYVSNASDGGHDLVDVDSIKRLLYKDNNKKSYIIATMKAVGTKLNPPDWKAEIVIDYDECAKNTKGRMLFTPEGANKESTNFSWDALGDHMYDYVGTFVCGFQLSKEGRQAREQNQPDPKKPRT